MHGRVAFVFIVFVRENILVLKNYKPTKYFKEMRQKKKNETG
jgi:hypothetical protein